MKLKLTKLASYANKEGLRVKNGEVIEVDEKRAQYLLKTGYFEVVEEEKKRSKR